MLTKPIKRKSVIKKVKSTKAITEKEINQFNKEIEKIEKHQLKQDKKIEQLGKMIEGLLNK